MLILQLVSCLLLLQVSWPAPARTTIVRTRLGPVRGLRQLAANNQSYWSFRGIPYAKPPVGKLRFAKPEPLPYSNNVIDATKFGAACIQDSSYLSPTETMSEDCLFLNVFTKDLSEKSKKVLVWIHGGGFFLGSAFAYNPGSLVASENIIVVTVNYRLGNFGFLSTEDDASPGNYGLWDQILAIKWVKRNIAAFGGDPNDITIAGESAGGASVSILSISPVTKGLFSKVYSHSGFATSSFANYRDANSDAINIAKRLNCYEKSWSSIDIIECLRSKPASSLTPSFDLFRTTVAPCVDGDLIPKPPLMLINDQDYLQDVGFYDREYFVALNNNEKIVIAQKYFLIKNVVYSNNNGTKEEKDASLKKMTMGTSVSDRFEMEDPSLKLVDLVSSWYEDRFIGQNSDLQILTDVNFIVPAFDILDAASQNPRTRVWFLYFNYYPSYLKGSERGMMHVLDVVYWFDAPLQSLLALYNTGTVNEFTEADDELKKIYSSIVADFLRGQVNTKRWPLYRPDDGYYLDFNSHPAVMQHLFRDTRRFWRNELPNKLSSLSSSKCQS